MLSVVVFLEARRDHVASLRTAILLHAANCLEKEPGCRQYDVGADPVDAASFLLYQVYENEAAYRAHKEYPHYAEFRLKVEPWIATRRILTFEHISGTGLA